MIKLVFIIVSFCFLYSCTGTHNQNIAKLEEQYGCDNPHKNLSKRKYRECLAKQRAEGETMFDLAGDINKLINNKEANVVYQNAINPYLWNASLEVTKTYPLKIADNQGGFIETEWIYNTTDLNQRCLIKIYIKSSELITTGISSSFVCEKKIGDIWISDNIEYLSEEKQITLKVLEIAGKLATTS